MKRLFITISILMLGTSILPAQKFQSYFDQKTGKYGYKDERGKIIIAAKYGRVKDFFKGFAQVSIGGFTGGKWGIIDAAGKVVVPMKYDEVGMFEYGSVRLAPVKLNGKYGAVNKNGKEVIPVQYDWIEINTSGYVAVNVGGEEDEEYGGYYGGKWGVLDTTGREMLPLKYEYIGRISKERIHVKQNGRSFYIDITGREVKE